MSPGGVRLKTESDGRVFPKSDASGEIIHCLLEEAKTLGVEILTKTKIESIVKNDEGFFLQVREPLATKKLILAAGSSAQGHLFASKLGHTIEPPVPSLFTFNVPSSPLLDLSGISFEKIKISIEGTKFAQTGPLLLTHFGFSGPSALKLSAWGARYLFEQKYKVTLRINWIPSVKNPFEVLSSLKKKHPQRTLGSENPFNLPKKFWKSFLGKDKRLNDMSHKEIQNLSTKLTSDFYKTDGKTTNKEEFVTCGGVRRKEVNFKTMESKICSNLFFAGEILDIDGITGGFNFQNAWTTGYIAGSSCD